MTGSLWGLDLHNLDTSKIWSQDPGFVICWDFRGVSRTQKKKLPPFIGHGMYHCATQLFSWLVLSDEQTSKRWQFSLLNDEQMSNWVGVKHLPVSIKLMWYIYIISYLFYSYTVYYLKWGFTTLTTTMNSLIPFESSKYPKKLFDQVSLWSVAPVSLHTGHTPIRRTYRVKLRRAGVKNDGPLWWCPSPWIWNVCSKVASIFEKINWIWPDGFCQDTFFLARKLSELADKF